MGRKECLVALAMALLCATAVAEVASSAFADVRLGTDIRVELPRNWTYLDRNIAQQINTSSEALGRGAGFPISQGDNEVLVAANSVDTAGKTLASLRVSARPAQTLTQEQMRELLKEPPSVVDEMLRPSAVETVRMVSGLAGAKSYAIRVLKVDKTGNLICTLSSFEGDVGQGVFVFDTWLCPIGSRNLKLSTSYRKSLEKIYRPTLEHVWQSLRVSRK